MTTRGFICHATRRTSRVTGPNVARAVVASNAVEGLMMRS
jgi:hypothetical protein